MSRQNQIGVTMDKEMQRLIVEYCEEYRINRSEAIRQLIQRGLNDWIGSK